MTELEPLKDKERIRIMDEEDPDFNIDDPRADCFDYVAIKSAVEWLKGMLIVLKPDRHKIWEKCSCAYCKELRDTLTLVNEAFPDIFKETKE